MKNDSHEEIIEVESIKEFTDVEQAEKIADKFAEVSNLYKPLQREEIVFPAFSKEDVPVISEKNVLDVLQSLNVSKSTRVSV